MRRTELPAGLDLGAIVATPEGVLVATRKDGIGTFGTVGTLLLPRRGGTAVAIPIPEAAGLKPPQLARARDGAIWALATVKISPERMGPALYRFVAGGWSPVTLPAPYRAERLVVDGAGRVLVLARGEEEGRWLLGETGGAAAAELPAR